jgi:transposase
MKYATLGRRGYSGQIGWPDTVEASGTVEVTMRGRRNPQASMVAFVDLKERVPPNHPLRSIKCFADRALATLSSTFDAMYGTGGRPSIPPERLLKAQPAVSLYSVRSERAFCEELDYHLLWRWFLDMSLMEPSFDQSTFSKNRGRRLQHVVAQHSSTRWFGRRMPWGCCRTSRPG